MIDFVIDSAIAVASFCALAYLVTITLVSISNLVEKIK